jgi:hypothetical protein
MTVHFTPLKEALNSFDIEVRCTLGIPMISAEKHNDNF